MRRQSTKSIKRFTTVKTKTTSNFHKSGSAPVITTTKPNEKPDNKVIGTFGEL